MFYLLEPGFLSDLKEIKANITIRKLLYLKLFSLDNQDNAILTVQLLLDIIVKQMYFEQVKSSPKMSGYAVCVLESKMANPWAPGGLDAIKGDYGYSWLVIITPIRGPLPLTCPYIKKVTMEKLFVKLSATILKS